MEHNSHRTTPPPASVAGLGPNVRRRGRGRGQDSDSDDDGEERRIPSQTSTLTETNSGPNQTHHRQHEDVGMTESGVGGRATRAARLEIDLDAPYARDSAYASGSGIASPDAGTTRILAHSYTASPGRLTPTAVTRTSDTFAEDLENHHQHNNQHERPRTGTSSGARTPHLERGQIRDHGPDRERDRREHSPTRTSSSSGLPTQTPLPSRGTTRLSLPLSSPSRVTTQVPGPARSPSPPPAPIPKDARHIERARTSRLYSQSQSHYQSQSGMEERRSSYPGPPNDLVPRRSVRRSIMDEPLEFRQRRHSGDEKQRYRRSLMMDDIPVEVDRDVKEWRNDEKGKDKEHDGRHRERDGRDDDNQDEKETHRTRNSSIHLTIPERAVLDRKPTRKSDLEWIVPVKGPRTAADRLQPTIDHAKKELKKAQFKALINGYSVNIAIGLQVVFSAMITGLAAVVTGSRVQLVTSILGGLGTVVASFLARARGTGEPERSQTRAKEIEHFLRRCEVFVQDHGLEFDQRHDSTIDELRITFEGIMGNHGDEKSEKV